MMKSLNHFIEKSKKGWAPISSETVFNYEQILKELTTHPDTAIWLPKLLKTSPEGAELYRDLEHGFVLTAYMEQEGRYRDPHDHGSGWVVYSVFAGEMEMSTYRDVIDQRGNLHLVRRERYRMTSGDCKVFLPRDIHDTRCISSKVTLLRFTSCDLKKEDSEGRMIRYLI